jgi:molybdate transport system substrate-binding protein
MTAGILAAFLLAGLVAACSGGRASLPPGATHTANQAAAGGARDLTIYAAASLKGVLDEAKRGYEVANPGMTLTISTASSAALETEIEQGAPADAFLSADMANPQKLVDRGFASGPVVRFARNELTIIVPKENAANIASPADLARDDVDVIAAGDDVPITKYANELVTNLAKEAGYPADFAARYAANIVSREEDVKGVVGKIELGQGDAGIVYVTDAAAAPDVVTIPVPAEANVPATYGGVVVQASQHPADATAFLQWLAGPSGQAILADLGFRAAPN